MAYLKKDRPCGRRQNCAHGVVPIDSDELSHDAGALVRPRWSTKSMGIGDLIADSLIR